MRGRGAAILGRTARARLGEQQEGRETAGRDQASFSRPIEWEEAAVFDIQRGLGVSVGVSPPSRGLHDLVTQSQSSLWQQY